MVISIYELDLRALHATGRLVTLLFNGRCGFEEVCEQRQYIIESDVQHLYWVKQIMHAGHANYAKLISKKV